MEAFESSPSQGMRVRRRTPPQGLWAPWRRGAWSSAEVALAVQPRRAELLSALPKRGDARGLAPEVLEEVVNDVICVVVMMRRPVRSESICSERSGRPSAFCFASITKVDTTFASGAAHVLGLRTSPPRWSQRIPGRTISSR